jgi:hypothetical protein
MTSRFRHTLVQAQIKHANHRQQVIENTGLNSRERNEIHLAKKGEYLHRNPVMCRSRRPDHDEVALLMDILPGAKVSLNVLTEDLEISRYYRRKLGI